MRLSAKLSIVMFLGAGILAFSVRGAAADQLGFAVDNTETLFNVDLTTATATPIGFTGQFLQGLAISPTGSLFATDFLGNLFSVSNTTGARLETYVIAGKRGAGTICMNGASSLLIKKGEEIIIMGFELTDAPVDLKSILVGPDNKFLRWL